MMIVSNSISRGSLKIMTMTTDFLTAVMNFLPRKQRITKTARSPKILIIVRKRALVSSVVVSYITMASKVKAYFTWISAPKNCLSKEDAFTIS